LPTLDNRSADDGEATVRHGVALGGKGRFVVDDDGGNDRQAFPGGGGGENSQESNRKKNR